EAALELARPPPPAGALVGRPALGGSGAGDAPDRRVSVVMQRVVRDSMPPDVAPDVAARPVGERLDLDDAAALVQLDFAWVLASCRLFAPNSRYPRIRTIERQTQRGDLADAAAGVRIPLPEPIS